MKYTPEFIRGCPNRLLDFGPSLAYHKLDVAYTVEKLTLWKYTTEHEFQLVLLRANHMVRARVQGTLYNLTDEQVLMLDKACDIGVRCERKRIPVLVQNGSGLEQVYAYVYIGRNDYWLEKVNYSITQERLKPTFTLPSRVTDNTRLLNNRFCFAPLPPEEDDRPFQLGPEMVVAVGQKNDQELKRLAADFRDQMLRDQEVRDQERKRIRNGRWRNFFSNEL